MDLKSSSTTQTITDLSELPKYSTDESYTLNMLVQELMQSKKQSYFTSETAIGEDYQYRRIYNRAKEEDRMNDNDLLKAYMDKISQDQTEIRTDSRESERRISERINEIEKRMDTRLNRIEDMIASSTKKTDTAINNLKESVDSKMRWVVGTSITTILGIAAMVVTAIVTLA